MNKIKKKCVDNLEERRSILSEWIYAQVYSKSFIELIHCAQEKKNEMPFTLRMLNFSRQNQKVFIYCFLFIVLWFYFYWSRHKRYVHCGFPSVCSHFILIFRLLRFVFQLCLLCTFFFVFSGFYLRFHLVVCIIILSELVVNGALYALMMRNPHNC